MSSKKGGKMVINKTKDEQTELIRTQLIVHLLIANVPQGNIRKIASCNMNRVNEVAKLVKPKKGLADG